MQTSLPTRTKRKKESLAALFFYWVAFSQIVPVTTKVAMPGVREYSPVVGFWV